MADKVGKLKELKELLDAGALTQDEFDSQKKIVLAKPAAKQRFSLSRRWRRQSGFSRRCRCSQAWG